MKKHVSKLKSLSSGNTEAIYLAKHLKVPRGKDAVFMACRGHEVSEDYTSFTAFDDKSLIKGSYYTSSTPNKARSAAIAEISSSFSVAKKKYTPTPP